MSATGTISATLGILAVFALGAPSALASGHGTNGGSQTGRNRGNDHNRNDDYDRSGSTVLAPHSRVAGKTIGEWTAAHWQWMFSFLEGQSPVFDDETGELAYLGDVGGPVFFAAAYSEGTRSFEMPCGKYVLIPLLTQAWTLEDGDTERSARAENRTFVASISDLYARVDGKRIPDLFTHREITPRLFPVSIPNGGLFGPEGGNFDAVSDGYWLMFKPFAPGKHTLIFGATAMNEEIELDIDYRTKLEITVRNNCGRH